MEATQDLQESERPVVLYHSRSYSRKHLLRVLKTEVGRDHPDYQLRHLLGNINLKEQHGRGLPCDTQIRRQEWDLDAVDRMIVELRRQLHTGDAHGLIIIQATDEAIISPVYPSGSLILRPMLMKLGRMRGIWLRETWLPELSSPRAAYDPDRKHFRGAHPQDMKAVGAIATRHAANFGPAITVRLAPLNPTIPAPSPFTPGGPPFYMPNPAFLGTNFDGIQGTYYSQDLRYDRIGTSDGGCAGGRGSSDGAEGGGCTGAG